jgi:hypothetical protein
MAVIYRCDLCGKETKSFRSLTFKRSVIAHGQVVPGEAIQTLDVCSDLCELQAATELLRRLSKSSSVDENGRVSTPKEDPGPPSPPGRTWADLSDHRR